ncbi:hypothetical protein NUACC21_30100 [Scytonema sp. NUACC21]
MNAQDFLTLLLDAIALSFIVIVAFDFIIFISIAIQHQKPATQSLGQFSILEIPPSNELLTEPLCPIEMEAIPDPWMLSSVEYCQNEPEPTTVQPQLLLPSSTVEAEQLTIEAENKQQPNVIEMAHHKSAIPPIPETTALVDKLLQGINIEKLQLRPARKIAKALNIAQKVQGKNVPLSRSS